MRKTESKKLDRRTFVTLLGATGTVAVAGCTDESEDPGDSPGAGGDTPGAGAGGDTPGAGAGEDTPGEDPSEETPGEDPGEETPGEGEPGEETPGEGDPGEETPGEGEGAADGESYEVQIAVADATGEPVEGATIEVEDEEGMSATDEDIETDANGEATVELPNGEYTLRVQAEGYAEAEEQVSVSDEDTEILVNLEEGNGGTSGGNTTDDGTTGGDTNGAEN